MCIETVRCRGISLIEQIVFIIIISVGVVGLISTMSVSIRHSADPMIRKQALVIAESLLTEVLNQPFTWCDPDDANANTATSAAGCALVANDQNKGGAALTSSTPAGEARNGGVGSQFDNVADYGGYGQTNATDAAGNNLMNGYATRVDVTRVGATFPRAGGGTLPDDAVLRVDVTVTPPGGEVITLSGYRFRYAPRY